MAKITAFTKENLDIVRNKLNAALEAVEKELGIKVDLGGFTYAPDGSSFKTQLTALAGETANDPLLEGVDARFIRDLQRSKGKDALKKKVKIAGDDAIILGLKGSAYIFRWEPGTISAKKRPGLLRMPYKNYDKLDCEVRGIPFDATLAAMYK